MPDCDKNIQDLISRMLTVDPASRITISQIKNHDAFRIGVPESYIFPTPIPLPTISDPIETSLVPKGIINSIMQIGMESEDTILNELQTNTHNMTKVFYTIFSKNVSLRSLPWRNVKPSPINSNSFFVSPQSDYILASPVNPKSISSLEMFSMNENPLVWDYGNSKNENENVEEVHEFSELTCTVEVFMGLVQNIFINRNYDFFYPNSLQLITKRPDYEMFVVVNVDYTSSNTIHVEVARIFGDAEEFFEIVSCLIDSISSISFQDN